MRAPRPASGTPTATSSSGSHPLPSPTVTRPPLSTSSEAKALASSTGAENGAQTVAVPSPIRRVQAATKASGTTGSSTDRCVTGRSRPTGCSTRWKVGAEAYPRSSARPAT